MNRQFRTKYVFVLVLVVVLFTFKLFLLENHAAIFAGGDGSPENPYQISTCEQLQAIKYDLTAHYILIQDIDCTDTINWNIDECSTCTDYSSCVAICTGCMWDENNNVCVDVYGFEPIGEFKGTFDGKGHTIFGLYISRPANWDYYPVGLFGSTHYEAEIKNVGLENINLTGGCDSTGGLVAINGGFIDNCYVIGNVKGCYYVGGLCGDNLGDIYNSHAEVNCTIDGCWDGEAVGGLVGWNDIYGVLQNCHSTGDLNASGFRSVGGLTGVNEGHVRNCYATGSVNACCEVGGLIGSSYNEIMNSFATGSVSGGDCIGGTWVNSGDCIGGLVGKLGGWAGIEGGFATGTVSGNNQIGGLIGYNRNGYAVGAYATGDVTGNDYVGGLIGDHGDYILYTYSTGIVSGSGSNIGGLIGGGGYTACEESFWDINTSQQSSSPCGIGKTTAEMKTKSTFTDAGWDFCPEGGTWAINEGQSYPCFNWEMEGCQCPMPIYNTPIGQPVTVTDEPTETSITFQEVTSPGNTTVLTSQTNPKGSLDPNFKVRGVFLDISTTATHIGIIDVCLDYSQLGINNPTKLKLLHWELVDGTNYGWVDVTTSLDELNNTICGTVSSLSWFVLVEDNHPPVANAGEDIFIKSEEQSITIIHGTAADEDPDDVLQYCWKEEETVLLDWTPVGDNGECLLDLSTVSLGIGAHTLTLQVTDGEVTISDIPSDDMILTIENSAPHAAPIGGGVYEINTEVTLGGNVSDYDGDFLSYQWLEGVNVLHSSTIQAIAGGIPVELSGYVISDFALGIHTITLCLDDGVNIPVSSEITVEVIDTSDPTLAPVADKTILWPPNHNMVNITIHANASDNSGLPVILTTSVSSNEPIDGLGDGDSSPDWTEPVINQESGIISLQFRAERSGTGDGRAYTITITATDQSGNNSIANLEIIVPHDRKKK